MCGGTLDACARRRCQRSIPACAGEPQRLSAFRTDWPGSIPACAGEPSGVHVQGLSPRVRGNLLRFLVTCHIGSIPACAGEPDMSNFRDRSIPACAGEPTERIRTETVGLSPRVRGNLKIFEQGPALRVYPRVCGGTFETDYMSKRSIPACAGEPLKGVGGLSPRVRGNLEFLQQVYPRVCGGNACSARSRSIPACAGEPSPARCRLCRRGLSPRVRGNRTPPSGLSPRVRGNLAGVHGLLWYQRSIPACAGEQKRLSRV